MSMKFPKRLLKRRVALATLRITDNSGGVQLVTIRKGDTVDVNYRFTASYGGGKVDVAVNKAARIELV